jgi:P4 family phage/plasmid primase-like protien
MTGKGDQGGQGEGRGQGKAGEGEITGRVGSTKSAPKKPACDPDQIRATLEWFHPETDAVFEVSIAKPKSRTSKWWEGGTYGEGMVSGWYNDKDKAVRDIVGCNTIGAAGLYLSLNPCHSALISRSDNRLKAGVARTTDPDMLCLRNIYIDIDPRRPKDTNSSNKEHAFSIEHALHVRKVLASHGFPDPLYASSGNGSHLVYQIEPLENTSENQELIREFLYAADSIFSINKNGILLNIDRSVHNPSRIGKIYGTTTQKGDAIEDRPHRMATIIDGPAPEARSKLSIETVKKFTEWAKQQDPKCGQDQKSKKRGEKNKGKSFNPSPDCAFFVDGKLDVEKYLQHYGIATSGKKTHDGSTLYLLKSCVFNSSHSGKESHIRQNEDGQLFYKCFHDSCIGKTWAEAREIISGDDKIGGRPPGIHFEYRLTDLGNTKRFVDLFGKDIRFCGSSRKWYFWDKNRWTVDRRGKIMQLAEASVEQLFEQANECDDLEAKKVLTKHAMKSESAGRLKAITELAETQEGVSILPEEMDTNIWLFNCQGGTIDLRNHVNLPHTRDHYITKISPVTIDPERECPNWMAFLRRIMDDNESMVQFLARAIGYTLTGSVSEQCFFLLWGTGKNGKALALDTPVPTPSGWTTQGALKVGDKVFGRDGKVCRVKALSPIWEDRPCYRVTFSDGTSVVADAKHEWPVRKAGSRSNITKTVTTEEIAARIIYRVRPRPKTVNGKSDQMIEYQWASPVCGAITVPKKQFKVDPYILGYWLGDGHSSSARITCGTEDINHLLSEVDKAEYFSSLQKVNKHFNVCVSTTKDGRGVGVDSLQKRLREMGLLGNKHIPMSYLRASMEQRIALLQGLMDSDGSSLKHQAQCEFSSVNYQLAKDVNELLISLGLRPSFNKYTATLNGQSVGEKWRILFTTPGTFNVFRMKRKVDKCINRKSSLFRKIVSCEKVDSVPVRCIEVDSADHTYLCGESMVPTHNSTFLEVIRRLMGDYAQTASFETFLAKQSETIRNDIARLKGSRFVSASESEKNKHLSEALVKQLTGDDSVTARFLFAEYFEYMPTFKIWMSTNYKPHIPGTDEGIWRRIKLIPFAVKIPEEERDKNLKDRLFLELPGILNWAVNGCLDWQGKKDLGIPVEVIKATAEYRNEQDVLAGFLNECCYIDDSSSVPVGNLFEAYKHWCDETGVRAKFQKNRFSTTLKERGFKSLASGHGNVMTWYGLGLLTQDARRKRSGIVNDEDQKNKDGRGDGGQGGGKTTGDVLRNCGMCAMLERSSHDPEGGVGTCYGSPWDGARTKRPADKCMGNCWRPINTEATS